MTKISKKIAIASSRYYIIVNQRVPKSFETNNYDEAKKILRKAKKIDRNAWICDNVNFGTWQEREVL